MNEALVKDRIARGDTPHDALLRAAKDDEEFADKLKYGSSARSAAVEIFMTPGGKVARGVLASFDSSPPRTFVTELRTVAAIARLRAGILVLGSEAKPDAIIAKAGMNRARGRKLLRWLADRGEYTGHCYDTPKRYRK